jgi:DNA polymerase III delta prime subunit
MNVEKEEKPDEEMEDLENLQEKVKENKRAKEDYPQLNRPIIFVCNDGYSKALYPLKEICLKLKVSACSKNRIQERLDEILKMEGFRTNVVNF